MSGSAAAPAASAVAGRARRQYATTVLIGILAASGVAVGVSKPWLRAVATPPGLPRIEAAVTGADLAPLLGALGLVLLAAFGAVLATRGLARRAIGVLIMGCAVAVVGVAMRQGNGTTLLRAGLAARGWVGPAPYTVSTELWRWLVLAGGVGCLAAGGVVAWRGPRWPTMGRRYDAPSGHLDEAADGSGDQLNDEALWRALDEGRDPTRRP